VDSPGDVDPRDVVDHAKSKNPNLVFECRHLRTKTMFYAYNRDNALSVGPACSTQTYWCVMTGTAIGPDSDVVGREECDASRTCREI
jgi:hypothetical protein